jgi:beta-glucosidase
MAAQALAAFQRVVLAPNEERRITMHVGARALSYFSPSTHQWTVAPGARQVMVGASSRDIRLRGVLARR